MDRLRKIQSVNDIASELRDTPIGRLLEYHNLNRPYEAYTSARLLIGMCMDNRKHLHIPENFAFIIRTGGANLRYSEFRVSYAIAIGGVRYIALVGHNQCGMSRLMDRQELFIQGMVEGAGWSRERAAEHFDQFVDEHEIGNEIDFVLSESKRLKRQYPKIEVAPFIYRIEDNLIYAIEE